MAGRRASGTIEKVRLADGSTSVRARFTHDGVRHRIVFGRDVDGWTPERGRAELDDVLAQLKAGIPIGDILGRYAPPPPDADESDPAITFHEYASDWLARRQRGEIGDEPLSESSHKDYLWRLSKHILPFFGRLAVAQISDVDCRRFRAKLFTDREDIAKIIAAGGRPTHPNGQARRPLSQRSIQKLMGLLAQILDDAVEDKLRPDNPARSKRLRVKVPKPNRTFLEIDQFAALLDAARELEAQPRSTARAKLTGAQAAEIRRRVAAGETQTKLCAEFGIGSGAMSMLVNGKTYRQDRRVGLRAMCATLGYAGPRISEALDLRERDVRLHDRASSRLWIADSKTATGIRHVEITPQLRDELLAHRADKIRAGYPAGPDDYFFCTHDGKRWDSGNVRQRIIAPAVEAASARMAELGMPPLPHVTPHTLRRTYVSIMLLATNFDVPFVQRQVGHADSKMTMDVYAQLLDRSKRDHGAAFDALMIEAQGTLIGGERELFSPPFSPPPDPASPAQIPPTAPNRTAKPLPEDGRGWFRTTDLSRVKRALSH